MRYKRLTGIRVVFEFDADQPGTFQALQARMYRTPSGAPTYELRGPTDTRTYADLEPLLLGMMALADGHLHRPVPAPARYDVTTEALASYAAFFDASRDSVAAIARQSGLAVEGYPDDATLQALAAQAVAADDAAGMTHDSKDI